MTAAAALFAAYPSLLCQSAVGPEFQSFAEPDRFSANGVCAATGVVLCESESYGRVDGSMAFADDAGWPVVMDAGPDPAEPLALNLGVTELFYLLRQDVLDIRATLDGLNANFDPGDLTVPFTSNL
jgi:hypothetical protein